MRKKIRIGVWVIIGILVLGWAIRVLVPGCSESTKFQREVEAPSVNELVSDSIEASRDDRTEDEAVDDVMSPHEMLLKHTQSEEVEEEEIVLEEIVLEEIVLEEIENPTTIDNTELEVHPGTIEEMKPYGRLNQLTVLKVIDGDTIDASDGNRYRFYGVNTPERNGKNHDKYGTTRAHEDACYGAATERTKELLPVGSTIYVEPGFRSKDPNGRQLGYVYNEDGLSVDQILVQEGLARAWTRDGHFKWTLRSLEAEARENKTGCLWSE